MTTLVTGAAGFVGFHVASLLLDAGETVLAVDVLRPDAQRALRAARLERLVDRPGFVFERLDLARPGALREAVAAWPVDRIVHLAAKTNVRASFTEPTAYVHDNITAFTEVLECARRGPVEHLVFASSGSVYGGSDGRPAAVGDATDRPGSFYAATKKANEMMAHSYADAHRLPCTALRLFNVYGPWARPDTAPMVFADAVTRGEPVPVFGGGTMTRTFTFVEDVASAIVTALDRPPSDQEGAPFRVANVANGSACSVADLLALVESLLGRRAQRRLLPMQPGEVEHSVGDDSGHPEGTPLAVGMTRFLKWFVAYTENAAPGGHHGAVERYIGA